VRACISEDEQAVRSAGDSELLALDAGKRFERAAGGTTAIRAVAIERIGEAVFDGVFNAREYPYEFRTSFEIDITNEVQNYAAGG